MRARNMICTWFDAQHVDRREQVANLDAGEGFFARFPGGALLHGLIVFHEPGRHASRSPCAVRLRAGTCRILTFPGRHCTHDHQRVAVVDGLAAITDMPGQLSPSGIRRRTRLRRIYCSNS